MSKRMIIGAVVSVALLAVFIAGIVTADYNSAYDEPNGVPSGMGAGAGEGEIFEGNGDLKEDSLAYSIFEEHAFVLIPLAVLMFGAMIGGVCISREEVEEE